MAVEIINVNSTIAIEFWDFKVGMWAEEILERFIE